MSRRTRKKQRIFTRPGTWKLIDDKSSFEISSENMVIDHNYRVTSPDNYDPPSIQELEAIYPPVLNEETNVPFSRPERTDRFVDIDYEPD